MSWSIPDSYLSFSKSISISKLWTLPNVLHDNSLCSALFLVLWQSLLCFSSCFFPEQNVSLLKWQAKKTGKFRLNTIVHYCDWLCSLKGSQSYKMCSLLGLEHLLEWIFNMPVEKPEEISSHPPTVNLGLKRNKIATACSGFKKKKSDPLYFFSQIILKSTRLLVYRLSNTSSAVSVEMCMRFFFLSTQTGWQDPDRRIPNAHVCFFTDIFVLLAMAVSVPSLEVGMEQIRGVRCSNTNRQ